MVACYKCCIELDRLKLQGQRLESFVNFGRSRLFVTQTRNIVHASACRATSSLSTSRYRKSMQRSRRMSAAFCLTSHAKSTLPSLRYFQNRSWCCHNRLGTSDFCLIVNKQSRSNKSSRSWNGPSKVGWPTKDPKRWRFEVWADRRRRSVKASPKVLVCRGND